MFPPHCGRSLLCVDLSRLQVSGSLRCFLHTVDGLSSAWIKAGLRSVMFPPHCLMFPMCLFWIADQYTYQWFVFGAGETMDINEENISPDSVCLCLDSLLIDSMTPSGVKSSSHKAKNQNSLFICFTSGVLFVHTSLLDGSDVSV